MKRTYVDANVLIAAFRGEEGVYERALEVLTDPDRKLVISDFLRLEVLPKPTFHRREEEVNFMKEVLENENAENIPCNSEVTRKAIELASKYDISPMDALHIGAAVVSGVNEFVTMEKRTNPLCKVLEIKVVSLYPG